MAWMAVMPVPVPLLEVVVVVVVVAVVPTVPVCQATWAVWVWEWTWAWAAAQTGARAAREADSYLARAAAALARGFLVSWMSPRRRIWMLPCRWHWDWISGRTISRKLA